MELYYNKPGAMPKILYVFMTGHYEVTVRFYLCIIIIVIIIIIYYYYYYSYYYYYTHACYEP